MCHACLALLDARRGEGSRPAGRLLAPIDPSGYASEDDLHDRLVAAANQMIEADAAQIMPDLALTIDWASPAAA